MNTTTENNKLIAEFMGLEIITEQEFLAYEVKDLDNKYIDTTLKYHKSWDWLMPVVEKIEATEVNEDSFNVVIQNNKCFIESAFNGDFISFEEENKLLSSYKSIVKFIKWYNQQNAE